MSGVWSLLAATFLPAPLKPLETQPGRAQWRRQAGAERPAGSPGLAPLRAAPQEPRGAVVRPPPWPPSALGADGAAGLCVPVAAAACSAVPRRCLPPLCGLHPVSYLRPSDTFTQCGHGPVASARHRGLLHTLEPVSGCARPAPPPFAQPCWGGLSVRPHEARVHRLPALSRHILFLALCSKRRWGPRFAGQVTVTRLAHPPCPQK